MNRPAQCSSAAADTAAGTMTDAVEEDGEGFLVDLDAYRGPFDVLLGLVASHRIELTQISLAGVTGEFIAYVHHLRLAEASDRISAFLDVASVLVEAKSAVLLPGDGSDGEDERRTKALRARDLLFARLLQYRAFKRAGEEFGRRLAVGMARREHPGTADPALAALLPALVWTWDSRQIAIIAARALVNAPTARAAVARLHTPLVDLRQQADVVGARLRRRRGRPVSFAELVRDAANRAEVVARFLALLVFFKHRQVQFKQAAPFEPLYLRWVMPDGGGNSERKNTTEQQG